MPHDTTVYDIAFGFDDPYAPHAAATITSIVRSAPGACFRFIILHSGLPEERRISIERLVPDARFVWIKVCAADVPAYAERPHIPHVSHATLFRLALERLAPGDVRRALYLDADVIVLRDVRELWKVDLGEHPLAAVIDLNVDASRFAKEWKLPEIHKSYFNAGVLLIDLDRVRAERLFSSALRFVAENNPALADQDGLNWALWDRWQPLDATWNFQRDHANGAVASHAASELRQIARNVAIVHYTGGDKPWLPNGYHPWSWLYWVGLSHTPFVSEIARRYGISRHQRLRLWLRWLRRRPTRGPAGRITITSARIILS